MDTSDKKRGFKSFMHEPESSYQTAEEAPIGVRYVSNYKAELVRHNIVTRTDLIRMYKPPLKKS